MHCPVTRKISYDSQVIAEEALVNHHIRQFHKHGTGPINVYQCEHCGAWHFTSKGEPNARLIQAQKDIAKEREGYHWERRFR